MCFLKAMNELNGKEMGGKNHHLIRRRKKKCYAPGKDE